ASFEHLEQAQAFAAQLSGKDPDSFRTIRGDLALRPDQGVGTESDARELAAISLDDFYNASDERDRVKAVARFLKYRGITESAGVGAALFDALQDFQPMSLLVNATMQEAKPIDELG